MIARLLWRLVPRFCHWIVGPSRPSVRWHHGRPHEGKMADDHEGWLR